MTYRFIYFSVVLSLLAGNTSLAQQRRPSGQTSPNISPTLKLPDTDKKRANFSCKITGLEMTTDGFGYFCTHKKTKYLVVFDGGAKPGGISASMSLLTSIKSGELGGSSMIHNRIKAPNKASQRICDLIQGPGGRRNNVKCRQAISFGWRLINTGSARPSSPNIPTQDAKPD